MISYILDHDVSSAGTLCPRGELPDRLTAFQVQLPHVGPLGTFFDPGFGHFTPARLL